MNDKYTVVASFWYFYAKLNFIEEHETSVGIKLNGEVIAHQSSKLYLIFTFG